MTLVLDTNALLWLREGSPKLGIRARTIADDALQDGELYVSAFSFWEVAMLVAKQRLELIGSVSSWRERVLADGVREIPVSGEIAIASAEFVGGMPDDPADRIITATAINIGGTLMTADAKLLRWNGALDRHDARI